MRRQHYLLGEKDFMNVFDDMGKYWAEIADQSPTDKQVQFIKNTVDPQGLILDLACGTGRHLIPLAEEGYSLVGLDISPHLLAIAKSRWKNADLVRADMRFLPFKTGAFAAAVSLDTSFGYLPSEEDDSKSLKGVRLALGINGVLVVDVFNREHLIEKHKAKSQPKWREYPSFFLLQERSVVGDGGELRDEWVIRYKSDGQIRVFHHVVRLYALDQLRGLLEKAGFEVYDVLGDYERQKFSFGSNRLILVAQRR